MIFLLAVIVIPVAILLMGKIVELVAGRWLDYDKARLVSFAAMIGYCIGGANRRATEWAPAEIIAMIVGLALLWWLLFKRETARG